VSLSSYMRCGLALTSLFDGVGHFSNGVWRSSIMCGEPLIRGAGCGEALTGCGVDGWDVAELLWVWCYS
jgi:hypothetical protein